MKKFPTFDLKRAIKVHKKMFLAVDLVSFSLNFAEKWSPPSAFSANSADVFKHTCNDYASNISQSAWIS